MTVRMYLRPDMGKIIHTNPFTLEPVVEHPILDIGSSYCAIKSHILEWLHEQYCDYTVGFEYGRNYIEFPTEQDMVWFKLRWL